MKFIFPLIILTIGCSAVFNENTGDVAALPQRKTKLTQEQIKKLDSVDVHFQVRGHCYAYNSSKNVTPSYGEGRSRNLAQSIDTAFPRKGLYMVINQNELIRFDSTKLGCKLYLVNTADSVVNLTASDSRLNIVAEALNEDNVWQPITYLPSSWCGNSYHSVALGKDEFWEFGIPVFKGNYKTKIRYTLSLGKRGQIHSNEVVAYINKEQLDATKQQGHAANGLMDPYGD